MTPDETRDLMVRLLSAGQELETARVVALQEDLQQAEARIAELEAALAECYRLSGADPDGNSDAMLARDAVKEVRRLRADADDASNAALAEWGPLLHRAEVAEQERDRLRAALMAQQEVAKDLYGTGDLTREPPR